MVKVRRRRMLTAAESAEIWDRWQRGEGLRLIGRVLGRPSSAISQHLKPHGGIRRLRDSAVLSPDQWRPAMPAFISTWGVLTI